jgi:hypothetical protein
MARQAVRIDEGQPSAEQRGADPSTLVGWIDS